MDYHKILNGTFFLDVMKKLNIPNNITFDSFLKSILTSSLNKIINYLKQDLTFESNRTNLLNYLSSDTHFFNCLKKCAYYVITTNQMQLKIDAKKHWITIFTLITYYNEYINNNKLLYNKLKQILQYYNKNSNEFYFITKILNAANIEDVDKNAKILQKIKTNNNILQSQLNNKINVRLDNENLFINFYDLKLLQKLKCVDVLFNEYYKNMNCFIYACLNNYYYYKNQDRYNNWKNILINLNKNLINRCNKETNNILNLNKIQNLYIHDIPVYTNQIKETFNIHNKTFLLKNVVDDIIQIIGSIFKFNVKKCKYKVNVSNIYFILEKDNNKNELIFEINNQNNMSNSSEVNITITNTNQMLDNNTFKIINLNNNCELNSVIDLNLISIITCYCNENITVEDINNLIKVIGHSIYYYLYKQKYCVSSDEVKIKIFIKFFELLISEILFKKYSNNKQDELQKYINYNNINIGLDYNFKCLNALYYLFISSDEEFNKNIIKILGEEKDIVKLSETLIKQYSTFYSQVFKDIDIKLYNNLFYPIVLNYFSVINPIEILKIDMYGMKLYYESKRNNNLLNNITKEIDNLLNNAINNPEKELIEYLNGSSNSTKSNYNKKNVQQKPRIPATETEMLINEIVIKDDF